MQGGTWTGTGYLDRDTVRGKLVTGQVGLTHKQPTADRTHSHVDSDQGGTWTGIGMSSQVS
jgi:hypothetical protein